MADTHEKNDGKARERLEQARDKLYEAADDVRERAGRIAGDAERGASKAGATIRDGARQGYRAATEKLGEGYERMSRDWGRKSSGWADTVRDNPGRALLVAAGVGFVLGLIFRQRGG